jgi:hypothetical protein
MSDDLSQNAAPPIAPTPIAVPNVFDQAVQQYPIIKRAGVVGIVTPKDNAGYLEFYPPGEVGSKDAPRPSALPIGQPGVAIYSGKTTPLDVLGDVTSHHLIHTDPTVQKYYSDFVASLTPNQQQHLQEQYQWARQKEGETRPYAQWLETAGLPGALRGYAFKQWPDDFNQQFYTPQQRQSLDAMMRYLMGNASPALPPQQPTTRLQNIP